MNATLDDKKAWEICCDYLHYDGKNSKILTPSEKFKIKMLGDGFGYIHSDDPCAIEILNDWSHIRDSSTDAKREMALKILEIVKHKNK